MPQMKLASWMWVSAVISTSYLNPTVPTGWEASPITGERGVWCGLRVG